MKKNIRLIVWIALIGLPGLLVAQKRIKGNGEVIKTTRNIPHFDRLSVGGSFTVEVVKGQPGKIEIEAESNLISYIVTDVKEGKLQIKWKKNINVSTHKKVYLRVYANTLKEIVSSGASDIDVNLVVKGPELYCKVSGAGDLKLDVDVKELKTKVSGAGDLKISGKCDTLNATVSGSGDQNGLGLKCNDADVKVSGAGDLDLWVINKLKGTASGSGDIKYKGNPAILDIEAKGAGDVHQK